MRRAATFVPVLAIWGAAAAVLAIPARRVVDWFWMTDELLYERLAFSVARTGSPLPSLHGQRVPVTNFLYPLILSTVVGHHLVPTFLVRAHTLNAVLMTSAAVPAFLLARDTLRSTRLAYAAAALTVVVPWVVLASFLLTESAAYPASLWALYLVQRAVARPSYLGDVLALAGLVLAVLCRTQLVVLFLTAPAGILLHEWSLRESVRKHRIMAIAAVGALVGLILVLVSGHGSGLLGSYASTAQGSWLTANMLRAFTQHAAIVAMATGFLPVILGAAWLSVRALRREPAALVLSVAILILLIEVTSFDVRFGGTLPHDRYLFYIAPPLLIGFLGALRERRLPRYSLVAPLVIVLIGLATAILPLFDKFNVETPASTIDNYLIRTGHGIGGARTTLVVCALLVVAIFYLARLLAPRLVVGIVFGLAAGVFLVGMTVYGYDRLFGTYGTAGRPISVSQGGVFDWVDRTVGPDASVTFVAYSQIVDDYYATAAFWWDLEFWNRSVVRAAYPGNKFAEIQSTFPKLDLHFDPRTGKANTSPTRYVAESDMETRFRLRGPTVTVTRNVRLIDAGRSWQADWISFGLEDDGFMQPGRPASVRVYPEAGQTKPTLRYVSFQVQSKGAPEGARFVTKAGTTNVDLPANGETFQDVSVCVPPHGYGTIHIYPHGSAETYGDKGTKAGIGVNRVAGALLERISLADETGTC